MSENNVPALEPLTDFTDKDLAAIEKYVEAGLPGIAKLDELKLAGSMDLYLQGKTYRQISMTMGVEKSLVLYLSKKFNWFELRRDYLSDLELSIRGRLIEAKVINQDFLLQLQQMWQKKIGSHITNYLRTNDEAHANKIDLKEVDKYLKTVEMLQRLSADPKADAKPLIGLNMGDGVTVTKTGDNSVEITPKQKAIGDVLQQFADAKRKEEQEAREAKEAKRN